MTFDKNISNNTNNEAGKLRPSLSLFAFLDEEISKTNDFYKSLEPKYDKSVYEQFEKRFIDLRNKFKAKLQDISDPDQEFINKSEMRRKSTEQILACATAIVGKFQEARENDRLDRSSCTDALENLLYALKNLKHLIGEKG
jgi:hypothetical protein